MKTNSDSSDFLASPASRKKFVLSRRKNERGQVAIFVALIFQVVFVFFALLINVGLLVHHKINLQHSTDLAAYYGAMKQAEQMNAIAHINFQMRQAWKLLTWRYRVLGTFGFIPASGGVSQKFPFEQNPSAASGFSYFGTQGTQATNYANRYLNGVQGATDCKNLGDPEYNVDGTWLGIQDIPFFCVGQPGIAGWPSQDTQCQLNCPMIKNGRTINAIPNTSTNVILGNSMSVRTNEFINTTNTTLETLCNSVAPTGGRLLTKFLVAYAADSNYRSETIKMLAGNLSQDVGRMVDLDGASIREGSKRTFENNLTGANFSGLSNNSFSAFNGLNKLSCRFQGGKSTNNTEFLKKIEFKLINFFIHTCTASGSGATSSAGFTYKPESLFDPSSASGLSTKIDSKLTSDEKNFLLSLLDQNQISIGYEKNPNCVEYFAVKTFSEPNIPFLPLSKVRLEATAIAKPFGGSIGPSYGKDWPKGKAESAYNDANQETKTDATLPRRIFTPGEPTTLTTSVYRQPNFSLFVGDHLGLRNLDYIATYHEILHLRDLNNSGYPSKNISNPNTLNKISNNAPPDAWPAFDNWSNISTFPADLRSYDPLASSTGKSAGMRAVEISALAPNQFDVAYYSIDPDFYNNYYIKLYNNFDKIKLAADNGVNLEKNQLRADFGAFGMDGQPSDGSPLVEKAFSVKDQILLKNKVLNKTPIVQATAPPVGAAGTTYNDYLNYLVKFQTSLLTGWTFWRFNDYTTFPNQPINRSSADTATMSFGQCDDPWNKTSAATDPTADTNFYSPMKEDSKNPPTPGNCVTGGRTGYSVKLVSPQVMMDANIFENPIDPTFFNF